MIVEIEKKNRYNPIIILYEKTCDRGKGELTINYFLIVRKQ